MSKETTIHQSGVDSKQIFSLSTLEQANTNFQDDRPLLKFVNQSDVRTVANSLIEEIGELNGKGKEGYWAEDQNREDYRQQELADIILFALTTMQTLGRNIDQNLVEQKLENFAYLGVEPVPASVPLKKVELFDRGFTDGPQAKTYEELRNWINVQKEVFDQMVDVGDQDLIYEQLHQIIATSFVIYYLIGLNPERATFEKVKRNQLKYRAEDYSDAILTQAGLWYTDNLGDIIEVFSRQVNKSNLEWDGPRDPITGEKSGEGTREFYGFYTDEELRKQLYENGWISSENSRPVEPIYRIIARALSWWYGWVNK